MNEQAGSLFYITLRRIKRKLEALRKPPPADPS
jgi:hypothetical protein